MVCERVCVCGVQVCMAYECVWLMSVRYMI